MKAAVVVYNHDGVLGRCTVHCYDAPPGPCHAGDCQCVCRGRNHGVGRTRAVHNWRAVAELYTRESVQVRENPESRQQLLGGLAWVEGSR